jgi:hypothetical protein
MTSPGKTEALDPITVEVVRYKLDGIANEMQSTLLRSSFSPIVKEGLDASASLFTADGTTLSQSCSIPIHLATLIPAVAKVLETYPIDGMRNGDIYILNDPYTGGTHLPDIAVIAPVFHRGKVIALSGAMTHHQDVGGMSAGSVPTNATEIYQEGLRIPPLKLRDGSVFNDTLVKMIRQNVRIPDTVMGDLNAQVAACTVAARRLAELADGYGHNQLASIFDELLQRVRLRRHQSASEGAAQLRAVRFAGSGVLRRARTHRLHHPDQRRLLPADQVAPAQRHHRQSARTCSRQRPDIHHQAHYRLHDRRARPNPAGARTGSVGGGTPGHRLRRKPSRRRPLRRR